MFINFYPKENFFKNFFPEGRPVWNLSTIKNSIDVSLLISKYYKISIKTGFHFKGPYSFILSDFQKAPENLKNQIPEYIKKYLPESFIFFLKNGKKPVIWIGGKDKNGFLKTLKFLKKVFPFLAEKYLIAMDLHIHTKFSDGELSSEDVFFYAVNCGLDGVAITDHETSKGVGIIRKNSPRDFPILAGKEIKDKEGNHLLVFKEKNTPKRNFEPEDIIEKWKKSKILFIQAHPTSNKYFLQYHKKAIGIEAFNFISSSPEYSREYALSSLRRGYKIPILGVSDCHLAEDIGKARTYLIVPEISIKAIVETIERGESVAFWRGKFIGKRKLVDILQYIYKHSDILSGKLVPLSNSIKSKIKYKEKKIENLKWKILTKSHFHLNRKIYCNDKTCDCIETWFKLNGERTFYLKFGKKRETILKINNIPLSFTFFPGIEIDIKHYLKPGENIIEFTDSAIVSLFQPRICLGYGIKSWLGQINVGNWKRIKKWSNLQILNIAPVNFKGEIVYKSILSPKMFFEKPCLFFDGTDGNIAIIVNDEILLKRSNAHWWDYYELILPDRILTSKKIEIIVHIENEKGLCGITNYVFAGGIICLRSLINKVEIPQEKPDFLVIRCGEQRVRAFLCDEEGNVLKSLLAGSIFHPTKISVKRPIFWIVLNSFENPLPLYQPQISVEYNI